KLADADWLSWARKTWRERDGRLVATYDPRLSHALAAIDPEHPIPPMWPQFDALADLPLMVIRGANSDLLSVATLEAMKARRNALVAIAVADQGHAPLLAEPDIIGRIVAFVRDCEDRARL